jgi:hypothetical protein
MYAVTLLAGWGTVCAVPGGKGVMSGRITATAVVGGRFADLEPEDA